MQAKQTFTQRMADMKRPGVREAARMMLAGDKSDIIRRIAGVQLKSVPMPSKPLGKTIEFKCDGSRFDLSLPF